MNRLRVFSTLAACTFAVITSYANAVAVSGQGTWETTLQARDLDGDMTTAEAYYDTDLNITWLADANYVVTSGYKPDGLISWFEATSWAAGLSINGYSGWRLPMVSPINGSTFLTTLMFNGTTDRGYNISAPGTAYAESTSSEIAHMFYNTLADKAYFDTAAEYPQPGWGLTNTGPFSNLQPSLYWTATDFSYPGSDSALIFYFPYGLQDSVIKRAPGYAWAVHSGDVGTPIVAAISINIDIKPGSTENPVNPTARGVLPVAILTIEDFDASKVDVSTILFGPGAARPVHYALEDVDSDTDWDLVLQFKTQDTGIVCGDAQVTLTGKTLEGVSFTGTDSIRTVGCK